MAVTLSAIIKAFERGVSVGCRDKIFYSVGCKPENRGVECGLGISLSFMLQTRHPYRTAVHLKLDVECRDKF